MSPTISAVPSSMITTSEVRSGNDVVPSALQLPMPFFLTYNMSVGPSMSICFAPFDAIGRHRELLLAGATNVAMSQDGLAITLAELELLVPGHRPGASEIGSRRQGL